MYYVHWLVFLRLRFGHSGCLLQLPHLYDQLYLHISLLVPSSELRPVKYKRHTSSWLFMASLNFSFLWLLKIYLTYKTTYERQMLRGVEIFTRHPWVAPRGGPPLSSHFRPPTQMKLPGKCIHMSIT